MPSPLMQLLRLSAPRIVVTIDIAELVNGNMVLNPQDAYALATAMIAIIVVTITLYSLLQRRASRWLR